MHLMLLPICHAAVTCLSHLCIKPSHPKENNCRSSRKGQRFDENHGGRHQIVCAQTYKNFWNIPISTLLIPYTCFSLRIAVYFLPFFLAAFDEEKFCNLFDVLLNGHAHPVSSQMSAPMPIMSSSLVNTPGTPIVVFTTIICIPWMTETTQPRYPAIYDHNM